MPRSSDNLLARVAVSIGLVILFTVAGVGIFLFLWSLKKEPQRSEGVEVGTAVRVIAAERGSYFEVVKGYGRARALREAEIAAEVPGVVIWISERLEAGASVTEGEELVKLDRRDYENAVVAGRARLAQVDSSANRIQIDLENTAKRLTLAKNDLEAAKRELARVAGLSETGVLTKSDLDRQRLASNLSEKEVLTLESLERTLEQDYRRVNAEIFAADVAVQRAQLDLDRTVIKAPYAGRITARFADRGGRVAPGNPLFKLVDLSRVEIPVALGASRFGEIRPGAAASVRLREDGEPVWRGPVGRISPEVRTDDRTFLVYLVVEGEPTESPVPPGAFVLAEVDGLQHQEVIAVPRRSFVGNRIFVADADGEDRAVIREVAPRVLRFLPEVALVDAGVEPGDLIVITNLEQIADGARVLLVRDEKAEEQER